jgi:hypothetical protein
VNATPLPSTTDCGVCGRPLVYATESVPCVCDLCGTEESSLICCPAGHYVCDDCHGKAALDVLLEVLAATRSCDPGEIIEKVMAHPAVPMHGPEHHAIVPGALVAAARNAGYPTPEGAVERAVERGRKVPGGWCGAYGTCGAAVGVGVAVSVLTSATPLKGEPRTLALAATSLALSKMLDDQARCCKRAARVAVDAGVDFLRDNLGVTLARTEHNTCGYVRRNGQCPLAECPFFS